MHFSREEWAAFCRGKPADDRRQTMEQHLYACDECLEVFLTIVTDDQLQRAGQILSPRFTQAVIAKLPPRQRGAIGGIKGNIFYYYVAVACLTLFFTGAGVFEGLIEQIPELPRIREQVEPQAEEELLPFGWTEVLMNKTLAVFDGLKPKA